jgi:hypothetical protein
MNNCSIVIFLIVFALHVSHKLFVDRIHRAAQKGSLDMVKVLLDSGKASVTARDAQG